MSGEYTPDQRSDLLHPYANECTEHFKHLGPEDLKREYNRAYSDARRWLSAEIAEAEKRGAVRALREASEALSRQPSTCKSPGCHRADQIILESRADQMEADP